jgi:hypothetical protein
MISCPNYDDEKNIKSIPFRELYYYEKRGLFDEFEFILVTFSDKYDYDVKHVKKEYRYQKYIYNSKNNNKLFYCGLFLIGCGICVISFKYMLL